MGRGRAPPARGGGDRIGKLTLWTLIEKRFDQLEKKMAQFDTDLQALTDANTALGTALNTGLGDLKAQIAALGSQLAGGTPVTPAQLSQLEAVAANLASETAAVVAADPGPQTPPTPTPPTP